MPYLDQVACNFIDYKHFVRVSLQLFTSSLDYRLTPTSHRLSLYHAIHIKIVCLSVTFSVGDSNKYEGNGMERLRKLSHEATIIPLLMFHPTRVQNDSDGKSGSENTHTLQVPR